jgi:hypothetical protein
MICGDIHILKTGSNESEIHKDRILVNRVARDVCWTSVVKIGHKFRTEKRSKPDILELILVYNLKRKNSVEIC